MRTTTRGRAHNDDALNGACCRHVEGHVKQLIEEEEARDDNALKGHNKVTLNGRDDVALKGHVERRIEGARRTTR